MAAPVGLRSIDLVDKGLVEDLLGISAFSQQSKALLALSDNARHVAVANRDRILVLPQQGAVGAPITMDVAGGDECLCLAWASVRPSTQSEAACVLIAGFASGRLRVYDVGGVVVWVGYEYWGFFR